MCSLLSELHACTLSMSSVFVPFHIGLDRQRLLESDVQSVRLHLLKHICSDDKYARVETQAHLLLLAYVDNAGQDLLVSQLGIAHNGAATLNGLNDFG